MGKEKIKTKTEYMRTGNHRESWKDSVFRPPVAKGLNISS